MAVCICRVGSKHLCWGKDRVKKLPCNNLSIWCWSGGSYTPSFPATFPQKWREKASVFLQSATGHPEIISVWEKAGIYLQSTQDRMVVLLTSAPHIKVIRGVVYLPILSPKRGPTRRRSVVIEDRDWQGLKVTGASGNTEKFG